LALEERVEEAGRISGHLHGGSGRFAAYLLESHTRVAEQPIADLDPLDQVDRDLLPCAVLLDRRGTVLQRHHLSLDGDVAARYAGIVEQSRVLEEDVDQLPE